MPAAGCHRIRSVRDPIPAPDSVGRAVRIQITRVAVTGGGGLVDFRFKVLDPEKARKLVGQPPTMPTLVAQGSGLKLETSHKMMHAIRLQ